MDPRLSLSPELRRELQSIVKENEKLAADSSPAQITSLRKKVSGLVQNEEFKKQFERSHSALQRLEHSLKEVENSTGHEKADVPALKKINGQIRLIFRDILGARRPPNRRVLERFDIAISENNHKEMREMFQQYAIDVHQKELLEYIFTCGDAETVSIFLQEGGDIHDDPQFFSRLSYTFIGNTRPVEEVRKIYKMLLDRGFNPNQRPAGKGDYPLLELINECRRVVFTDELGVYEAACHLLREMFDLGIAINPEPDTNSPYLMDFWTHEQPEFVEFLLANGAYVTDGFAKQLEADPRYSAMWAIREEALRWLNQEISAPFVNRLKESKGLEESPMELIDLMGGYTQDTLITISRTPTLRHRLAEIYRDVKIWHVIFKGIPVSDNELKRLQSVPYFQGLLEIRQAALERMTKEIPELAHLSPEVLLATVFSSPELCERLFALSKEIYDER